MRTLAIIAARGGSKRLPGKNIRPFCGTPLIAWSIRFARSLPAFDAVEVSTDSEEIAAVATDEGLPVAELRPSELASDTASSAEVALHVLGRHEQNGARYDTVALLQPTSPIRLSQRWATAFELLEDRDCDAAVGIAPAPRHPFHAFALGERGTLAPFVAGEALRVARTQDLPPVYIIAGNLYLIRTAALIEQRTFFPPRTAGVICDEPYEAIDIDTEPDWIAAEAVAKHYGQEPWPRS